MSNRGMVYNVMIVGVGGQGVLSLSKMLAHAASACFPFVCGTESRGLSQRGGTVSSEVRFGYSQLVPATHLGSEDLVLSLDALEALRVRHLVHRNGLLITNSQFSLPLHLSGIADAKKVMATRIDSDLQSISYFALDLSQLAAMAGSGKAANSVLLGAASLTLPIDASVLRESVRITSKADCAIPNINGFDLGRQTALEFHRHKLVS